EISSQLRLAEAEMKQRPATDAWVKDMEHKLALGRTELEQASKLESQLRAQEAELAAELRTEQAKADELASKIEGLERALTPPAQPAR
ncbi:MAG TPA: hypothetical protein VFL57_22000, partial [Bryobacteraceae bacterium]|nr:hypothetical protein [Bryobacteraceae bacterium]